MSAAVAAMAVREEAQKEEARKKAARRAAEKAKQEALAVLNSGPVDFTQAVKALKAAREAEEKGGIGAKIFGIEALYNTRDPPPEVRGKSGKTYNSLSLFCLAPKVCASPCPRP